MATKYNNLPRKQRHISIEMDRIIKNHQKSLQRNLNFTLGKKAPTVSYIFASKNLAKMINGGVRL